MAEPGGRAPSAPSERRDARRNRTALLAAAAEVFEVGGVDAPVREIAARAGVGVGTIYRHFPSRADLVVAVYLHQVDDLARAGPALLARCDSPTEALRQWVQRFVGFLVTKHGLAVTLASGAGGARLHDHFLDVLVPVCGDLLAAGEASGEISPGTGAYELMRAVGNLCIDQGSDGRYDARHMVDVLLSGLRA